ncbi:carbon-nitrogen hydrolase family protein [Sphingorhabdus sp. Alg239-R122]|uniref:carbon-nitrogen hydrolase family protein n=1 Tax=Sphingorhabdus sp. Alg239-R122 TaxID=2305989 RepID=UPI0013DC724E|nr:carbon-nitrogen hydrolase family protein [Sphingorhabdus sp. Alg239-R122]
MKTAIVQAAPVPLDITEGLKRLLLLLQDAIDTGAELIAFGETFLGGYPLWLDEASDAAKWDHPGTKALHAILLEQAVRERDSRFEPLQALVDKAGVMVSVGAHERRRNSLYNNQILFRSGLPPLPHRKLVPTHGERLIWNRGDGSTLDIHDGPQGKIGNLVCWEHWMPLARAAMHNQGEMIHVAAWPTVRESYSIASRHYAFEGRCFVLAAGTVQHRDDLLESIDRLGNNAQARTLVQQMDNAQLQFGGSQIIAPDAEILAQAGDGTEIITAELDMSMIGQGLASLDTDGHYSRADVFELRVDRSAKDGVVWKN